MNKRTFLKSLVAAGCVAAFSLGSFSSACAEEFREVTVGVVGDYVAQWDTVNELLAPEKSGSNSSNTVTTPHLIERWLTGRLT